MTEFRLTILTPTTGMMRSAYTVSLANLITYYAQHQVIEGIENQYLAYHVIEGSGISSAREKMVAEALETETTHILFIDEDMGFAADTLHRLARRRLPIVGCNYPMRVKGKGFTALAPGGERRIVTNAASTGVEPCHYTGFGFCLIERSVFERAQRPWFLIGYNTETQQYTTEDAAFARRLPEIGVTWMVDHDASKSITHVGPYHYSWKDYHGTD